MNKQEYHDFLNSDYWKGYSYSIIKERNFTCEDCGRSFPNQRNMLQVHHLTYRDVAPWSYKPEELVVLCRECHMKRHGILSENAEAPATIEEQPDIYSIKERYRGLTQGIKWGAIAIFGLALFVIMCITIPKLLNNNDTMGQDIVDNNADQEVVKKTSHRKHTRNRKVLSSNDNVQEGDIAEDGNEANELLTTDNNADITTTKDDITNDNVQESAEQEVVITHEKMQDALKEVEKDKKHAKAVKKAIRANVSTEGTTGEILARIKAAKEKAQDER